ncbi:MAG: dockerin type I domain-containing protein [Phycisphaerales bacterium JB038]
MRQTLAIGLIIAAAGAASADVYDNETDFVAQLIGDYYFVDFNEYVYGDVYPETTLSLISDVGFSYDLFAYEGLWAGDGNMSTNNSGDPIYIISTGDPIHAVGGLFFGGDISGLYVQALTTVTLSDGQTVTFDPADPYGADPSFLGFTSPIPIETVEIDADDTNYNAWATVDNLYVGYAEVTSQPGDVDGDGDVDQSDLGLLLAAYESCDGDPNWNPDADLNGDGCVNQPDLGILLANYQD